MPRKAAERAIALGEDDPFQFVLAENLGKSLVELEDMPQSEYVRWVAFNGWRTAMQKHASDVARMRAR